MHPTISPFSPLHLTHARNLTRGGKKISALEKERQFPPCLRILFLPALEAPLLHPLTILVLRRRKAEEGGERGIYICIYIDIYSGKSAQCAPAGSKVSNNM